MPKKPKVLALWLDGPMQSWGHGSKFDRRTTLSYPTRSGIIGLIAAALGLEREDAAGLDRLSSLRMEALAFPRARNGTPLGPVRWIDYHTVGGGYDPKTERHWMVPKANRAPPDPVQTYREYLTDVRFGVLLCGEGPLLEELRGAIENPRWGVWLGRKCCIPAAPIAQGVFPSPADAEAWLTKLAGTTPSRRVTEVDRFEDGSDTLMDVPKDYAGRQFRIRRVLDEPC